MFLEDLDSMLTSGNDKLLISCLFKHKFLTTQIGNIPDLFDLDELDAIYMEIKQDAYLENVNVDDKSELYKYLINVS